MNWFKVIPAIIYITFIYVEVTVSTTLYGCYREPGTPCSNHTITCTGTKIRIDSLYYFTRKPSITTCPQVVQGENDCTASPCCSHNITDIKQNFTQLDALPVFKACSYQESCSVTSPYIPDARIDYVEYGFNCGFDATYILETTTVGGTYFEELYLSGALTPTNNLTCSCNKTDMDSFHLHYVYLSNESCNGVTLMVDGLPIFNCSSGDIFLENKIYYGETAIIQFQNYTSNIDDVVWFPTFEVVSCDCYEQAIAGGWSVWTNSPCSVSCGKGMMNRTRECNNPTPTNGGASCNGSFTDTVNCTQPPCSATGHRYASYSKSNVVINTCDPSTFLETIFVSRRMDCPRACTEKVNCKRYLYCKLDSSCRLYHDGRDCVMSDDTTGCSCYTKNIGCENSGCTCPLGYYGDRCQDTIIDCTEGFQKGFSSSNDVLTNIKPVTSPKSFEVLCTFIDGGWTGILNRNKYCSNENFNRTLAEYEAGFGNVASNKWLGYQNVLFLLDNLNSTYTLGVHLYSSNDSMCISNYYNFTIGNKSTSYKLSIGGYTDEGISCGDSLTGSINLNNNPFSTYDVDYTGAYKCPMVYGGGWWYGSQAGCTRSFLTGTMDGSEIDNFWNENMSDASLTHMYLKLLRN